MPPTHSEQPILEIRNLSKSFPGVKALDRVRLDLYPGQVTALIGENGAGKSTLVKALTGIYRPDEGEIRLDGSALDLPTPDAARRVGITAIHQETVMFDELSVTENVFVGHHIAGRFGRLDWAAMRARTREILAQLEVELDPDARLKTLSVAQKHIVGIARALSVDAKIVIMDEPTAALSQREIDDLYGIVRRLKREDKAILFISHKFDEVFQIADRYVVLRDGAFVGEGLIREVDQDRLVTMMVGRTIEQVFPKLEVEIGEIVLDVNGLSHPTEFADISFDVHRGEIVGFYGLVGAGRSEVMQAVFGITKPSAGEIRLGGQPITIKRPGDAIAAGIVYVPEDRQHQGAVLPMAIAHNIGLPQLDRTSRYGFLDEGAELELAHKYGSRLQVKTASWMTAVEQLSGGNQQKVVIGRWLATRPKVIILDEPTKGIDVGSKAAVHAFMSELAREGLAVVMVSSELPEILGMADRIVVMHEGRIRARLDRAEATPEAIVTAASGAEQGALHA
ncbi:MAG TPA: sugar ABC transporter ATP-binding protein [Geminicoccaceae bacterium]|nr:sugar ABC transporter ATP-binding protein [Geminicoccaceae bacterium]